MLVFKSKSNERLEIRTSKDSSIQVVITRKNKRYKITPYGRLCGDLKRACTVIIHLQQEILEEMFEELNGVNCVHEEI